MLLQRQAGSSLLAARRIDLLDHLEDALYQRILYVLGDPLEAVLITAVAVADAVSVGERALIETERDDEVLVVLVAQVVGPDRLRGPALGLPGVAEVGVGAGRRGNRSWVTPGW